MNDELSAFDRLVLEMDSQERRSLLVRIQGLVPVFAETLGPAVGATEGFVLEEELHRLGLLHRLLLFVQVLFSRRDRVTLLRGRYLRRLAAGISRRHAGLADFRAARLGAGLRDALVELQGHARVIDAAFGADSESRLRELVAFLAREDLASFQAELLSATDPPVIFRELGLQDEKDVRAAMLQRFDKLLVALPEESTGRIRTDTAALFALHGLASHPFEALLAPFASAAETRQEGCPFTALRRPLEDLARVLAAVAVPPSSQAVYDLFLFRYEERLEDRSFDLQEQLLADLPRFQAALKGIREFHERVPLTALLRCLSGNPGYTAGASGPRHDWLALYGEFWRQRLQARFLEFYHARLADRLRAAAREFFSGADLPNLVSYRDDRFGPRTPVQHGLSAAFLKGLAEFSLAPLLRPLKLIYLNGEFYKQDNRQAFTDGFVFLSELDGSLARIESRLGPQGDLRALIQAVKSEPISVPMMSRRIRKVLTRADSDVRALVDKTLDQLESMELLLAGILKGRPGDRYDSLANLERVGGRENKSLRSAWARAIEQTVQARRLLREILDLEIRQG
jgi:hypothetical protein